MATEKDIEVKIAVDNRLQPMRIAFEKDEEQNGWALRGSAINYFALYEADPNDPKIGNFLTYLPTDVQDLLGLAITIQRYVARVSWTKETK